MGQSGEKRGLRLAALGVNAAVVATPYIFIFAISLQDWAQRRHSSAQAFIFASSANFAQLSAQRVQASAHRPQLCVYWADSLNIKSALMRHVSAQSSRDFK
ncbi:MAG TPA: hypothetical protein VIU38_00540 [Anaerolineales bacterium]